MNLCGHESPDKITNYGVRLDDMTAAYAVSNCVGKLLRSNWPAVIDLRGMIRANRVPLAYAAKMCTEVGSVNLFGKPAKRSGLVLPKLVRDPQSLREDETGETL